MDDDEDDGGAVVEVPDDAVTSSPSCDPWGSLGCWRRPFLGGAVGNDGPASVWISEWR